MFSLRFAAIYAAVCVRRARLLCGIFFGYGTAFFPDLGTKDTSFPLLVLLYLWRIVRMGEMAVHCLFPFSSFGMALDICVCFWDELFLWATGLCLFLFHYYCMKIAGIYLLYVCIFTWQLTISRTYFVCADCLGFGNPDSMPCQSLIRRRGAAGGVCLIIMPAAGSLSQMHSPLPLQGCLRHCLVMCSYLN